MSGALRELSAARYVNLATYRRDGREVRTPIWLAADGDALYCFSAGRAGKVKRVRATGRVRLAICTFNGEPRGPWYDGTAHVTDSPEEVARAYVALRAKYGLAMYAADAIAHLSGRFRKRAIVAIRLSLPAN